MKDTARKTHTPSVLPILFLFLNDDQAGLIDLRILRDANVQPPVMSVTLAEVSGPIKAFVDEVVADWDSKYTLIINEDTPIEVLDLLERLSADQDAVCTRRTVLLD